MNDTVEFHVKHDIEPSAVNGLVCAFALLIDALESNGALRPQQFEGILASVLRRTAGGADVAVLQQILGLLQSPELPTLTVIDGGKT